MNKAKKVIRNKPLKKEVAPSPAKKAKEKGENKLLSHKRVLTAEGIKRKSLKEKK